MERSDLTSEGIVARIALGVFGLLTVSTLVLVVFNDKGVLQVRSQSQRLEKLHQDIQGIEKENSQLGEEIKALRTDPNTIERLAREDLKLVKPGEVVIVSPNEKAKSPDR